MARKLRLQYEGAIYHVTVRGNGRRRIFIDDRDRDRILWRLCESKETYQVRIYVYCLMDNHLHLLLETPRGNLSRFMQSVLTGYTVYFNLRHRTSGHVLQGRYGAQLVQGDNYLLAVSRYIHQNPIHTREIRQYDRKAKRLYLRAYRWSSYRGYTDDRRRNELVEYGPILSLVHGPKREWPETYRSYVESELSEADEKLKQMMKVKTRGIGSKEFRKWVDKEYRKLKESMGSQEDVSFRKDAMIVDADEILKIVAKAFRVKPQELKKRQYGSLARPVAARLLCKYADMSQREAGRLLGYGTGAAVSYQLGALREKLEADTKAARATQRLEKECRKRLTTNS